MMKNRQFMMGLGIGLIAGSLLLQIMMIGQRQPAPLTTREQVEQAAASLNLRIVEQDQELLTEEEWQAKSKVDNADSGNADKGADSKSEPVQPSKPQNPEEPAEPKQDTEASAPEADKPQTKAPDQPDEPKPAYVQFTITAGSKLSDVAAGLQTAGVIEDKKAFVQEAVSRQVNYKIQSGTFTFKVGESINSILNKIAPKPAEKKS